MKTYALDGSPSHWHYILHSGPSGRTREHYSTETFKTFEAAMRAAEKFKKTQLTAKQAADTAVAGWRCLHNG